MHVRFLYSMYWTLLNMIFFVTWLFRIKICNIARLDVWCQNFKSVLEKKKGTHFIAFVEKLNMKQKSSLYLLYFLSYISFYVVHSITLQLYLKATVCFSCLRKIYLLRALPGLFVAIDIPSIWWFVALLSFRMVCVSRNWFLKLLIWMSDVHQTPA